MNDNSYDYEQSIVSSHSEEGKSDEDAAQGKFAASGWVEKRAPGKFLGGSSWQRRFALLEDQRLYMSRGGKPQPNDKTRQIIDLAKVECVCFHYDESSPVKSKKIEGRRNDTSRFDIYAADGVAHLRC